MMGRIIKCTWGLIPMFVGISCHDAWEPICPLPAEANGFNFLAKAAIPRIINVSLPEDTQGEHEQHRQPTPVPNATATVNVSLADDEHGLMLGRSGVDETKPRGKGKKSRKKSSSDRAKATRKNMRPPWKQRFDQTEKEYASKAHSSGVLSTELMSCCFWFAMCVGAIIFFCWEQQEMHKDNDVSQNAQEEQLLDTHGTFDEDMYGLSVGMLIRDAHAVAMGTGMSALRWSRVLTNTCLLYFTMTLQVFLMMQVQRFVTPGAITNVRTAYSEFEWKMHGESHEHGRLVASNLFVGDPKFFNPDRFAALDEELKKHVCHIPFSQPVFCIAILFMWTLTCSGELRKSLEWFEMFVWTPPTVDLLQNAVSDKHEVACGTWVIHSLTKRMKVLICAFVLIPRSCIAARLIWIGCRWLSATNDFGDLIMNAMALEFILLLKDLLYIAVVSNMTKRDLATIEIRLHSAKERPNCAAFFTSLLWGVAAILWSMAYTFQFQQVLPEYNWDVRKVCTNWLRYGGQ